MPDFSKRSSENEMMDDFMLGHETIDPIMDELEVINKLLGGYSIFFDALKQLKVEDKMRIVDWGCGGGDSLRELAKWARKRNLNLSLVGLDATASAIEYAQKKSVYYPEISYMLTDVLSDDLPKNQFDIVISSLFTHHFKDESWIRLIKKMASCAKHAVIINDLHRHWLAYYSIGFLTQLFSRSAMVKHDSMLSVMRSFKRNELESLLKKAGLTKYKIRWMWAFRWQVIIYPENE